MATPARRPGRWSGHCYRWTIWPQTAKVLNLWFPVLNTDKKGLAFPAIRRTKLSADALNHLLQQAVTRASATRADLDRRRVTPHVVHHTTAMHLLQASADIAVLALWLPHESIETAQHPAKSMWAMMH